MEALAEIMESIGMVKQIGNRICEKCGQQVPIMQRGNEEVSTCLNCENIKLTIEMVNMKKEREADKVDRIFREYSVVPEEIANATLKNFAHETDQEKEALEHAVNYVKNFNNPQFRKLIFAGSYGTGKSHLSYAITKLLRKGGLEGLYITAPGLVDSVFNAESQHDVIKIYQSVDFLVIDELGAETVKLHPNGSSWVGELMFKIIDARTDKHTIFTTNLSSEALTNHYGQLNGGRIVSRMKKNAKYIQLTGRDRRGDGW